MRLQGLNHGDIDARAAAHQQLCARLGRQALGTRGKLGVNDLVVRHCVDRELRRRAQRAFRRCEHTRSRHVCAFSLSVRDVLLSQAATFFSTFACGFANDKYLAPVRPQCQPPDANFPRPVPLLRPASTRTMGSSLRASASARHASYTASALRGGRSGRVIRAAPVRSAKGRDVALWLHGSCSWTCWTASALPARYAPILAIPRSTALCSTMPHVPGFSS